MEPIRVLQILHSMNRGGAENALMNYYRNIDKNLVQFDFLLSNAKKGLFEDEIVSMGGRIFKVPLLTMNNPFPYLRAVDEFFKEHSEYKIVHSHTSSKSVFPLGIAKRHNIPVRCSHSHGSMSENGVNGIIRNALKPFLKTVATDWLACGEQAAVWLYGKKSFKKRKVAVYKNVIETEKFKFDKERRREYRIKYNVPEDVLLLGHTANFNKPKNHLFDIDILRALKEKNVKCKLMLVGDGPLKDEIIKKAKENNVLDDMIFIGVVPNVYDFEQAFDAFILPSFYEGLPLSIIEAQVSGLPCFTTKERVSSECSVTDLVTYLPLEVGANVWAERIMEASKQERRDRCEEVASAGYDAKEAAKNLQNFYLKKYNEIEHRCRR